MDANAATGRHAEQLHSDAVVIDLHSGLSNDVVRRRISGARRVMADVHVPKIRGGGLDAVCVSVGGDTIFHEIFHTDRNSMSCLMRTEAMLSELDECPDLLALATTAQGVLDAKAAGKTAILLGIEGARPLEDRLELLSVYYRLGVRRLQLTWNYRNAVADGCSEEKAAGGLTTFGRQVVREVNRLGIILDLSHISESSFWSAMEVAQGPVVVSHANCHAVHPHPRNMKDDQIQAIAKSGGLIGIGGYSTFVGSTPEPSLAEVAAHIEHAIALVGADHVGIGPDYMDHNHGLSMTGSSLLPDLYPASQSGRYAVGMGTFAETGNLTRELVRRGHSDEVIRKILGGNYLRIFRAVFHG